MITSDFVQAVLLKATGKVTSVTSTDKKWLKVVAIANRQIKRWEIEADWNSLYDPEYSLGAVTATDTFAIPAAVRKLSDTLGDAVIIEHAIDPEQQTIYDVVSADRLKLYKNGYYCAQIGSNLVFNRAFTADDPEFGGELLIPAYTHATELIDGTSIIPVDDPEWLITITAAEYVRNDITKQNQYPNLITEANDILAAMIDENDGQFVEVLRPWSLEV